MLSTYFRSIARTKSFDFYFFVTKEYLEHSDVDEVLVSKMFNNDYYYLQVLSTNVSVD